MKQGWEYKKLDSCAYIEYGTRVVQKKDGGTIYPVYGGGGETFRIDRFNREDCLIVARFAMSPLCVRYVKGKFFLNDSGLSVKAGKELYQSYLNHHIKFLNDKIYNLGKGAAQRNLDVKSFKNLQLGIPPKSTQLTIVSELDKINELISLKKEQLKDYDNLAQSIFYEMFGDPVENDKGWEVKKLGEISSLICNGNTPKGGSEVYVKEGFLFLRSQNVWKNRIDLEDVAYIDESTHLSLKKSILKHNDLLITKTGRINTENSSLGRTALFEGGDGSANINGHVYLVRLKENMVHKYILYILISNSYRELIRKTCVGGIDKRQLNKDHIEDFPIIFPPIELQKIYSNRVSIIERQKSAVQKSITDLETLLASRMQYWFE
ncbi:MAG: restriction endonuclease subunit S [Prevotella sp.]|uniref:restriction endonuclease subunit S n=1 Tax=Prevotella sp. TaxID=59823 RepID=UPI0025EB549C|nr:restriction endonuclease subunit S [Prevotella sp.]MCI7118601.1 restriction endonuclease subunit S [Prevotella sp.]